MLGLWGGGGSASFVFVGAGIFLIVVRQAALQIQHSSHASDPQWCMGAQIDAESLQILNSHKSVQFQAMQWPLDTALQK